MTIFNHRQTFWLTVVMALCQIAPCAIEAQVFPVPKMLIRRGIRLPFPIPGEAVAAEGDAKTDDESEQRFPGGPALKTDPEAGQLLQRAEQFSSEGRHDLAAVLWQKVLDDSGDNLVTDDGRLYISLRRQVEKRLGALPDKALAAYRLSADGDARAVLAAAGTDRDREEEALNTIVRRFFLSSLGDDAAYKLGCLALDRYDFVVASSMFQKVLDDHPDPSMSRGNLLLRLAVATGRMGDREGAERYLGVIQSELANEVSRSLLGSVDDDTRRTRATENIGPYAYAPALPADVTSRTLTENAFIEFPLLFRDSPAMNVYYEGRMPVAEPKLADRDGLVDQWREQGWMPAGKVLFHGDRVLMKTHQNIASYSRSDLSRPVWASVWNNEFAVDDYSRYVSVYFRNMGLVAPTTTSGRKPQSTAEVFLFGDRIHHDMNLAGDMLYTIEGRPISRTAVTDGDARTVQAYTGQVLPARTRTNWLTAYNLRSGKVKWSRTAADERKDERKPEKPVAEAPAAKPAVRAEASPSKIEGTGFMAAPVACGPYLLVPVSDGGSMKLQALLPETGSTVWITDLCDEPEGGSHPWSPVAVTVEGREAYVLCGTGVVFSIDGTSGAIRWVARYQRPSDPLRQMNPHGGSITMQKFDGFAAESLISFGRLLVVLASDSDELFALDRRTGELAWQSPRKLQWGTDVSYCLGVNGTGLFLAGPTAVRRYDLVSGKILWETEINRSYGRGVLTSDAIYVPVKDSVLKLDLERGRELAQVGVSVTSRDPAGNLYSDGQRLWMLGANRLSVLTHLDLRLEELGRRIGKDDAAAWWERFTLHLKLGKDDLALNDLLGVYALQRRQAGEKAASDALLKVLEEQRLTRERPEFVFAALTKLHHQGLVQVSEAASRAALEGELNACLNALPRESRPGLASLVLESAPLLNTPALQDKAARVLRRVATADDLPQLQAAMEKGGTTAMLVAETFGALAGAQARPLLQPLADRDDMRIRLLGVKALVQSGDTAALPRLTKLMASSDMEIRSRSYRVLRNATGHSLPFTWTGNEEERNSQIAAWDAWLVGQQNLKLRLPLVDEGMLLGRTLVCTRLNGGMIREIDSNHNLVSERRIPMARCVVGLPNGHRLVSEPVDVKIVEYNEKWEPVWSVDGFPTEVSHIDRGTDGKTLAVCAGTGEVYEVSPEKQLRVIRRNEDGSSRPVFARRLDNGNTLYCLQGANKVIEVNPAGRTVMEIASVVNPVSAQRLDNGNTVVCYYSFSPRSGRSGLQSTIAEFDAAGKELRKIREGINRSIGATLLDDGRLMYIDMEGLHEAQADGKELWNHPLTGIISFSHF